MKKIFFGILTFLSAQIYSQTEIFHELLQKHVSENGHVNYTTLSNDVDQLKVYTKFLADTKINNSWSDNKKKAFWINAYNAYTLILIIEENEKKSIMNIKKNGKSAWKIPFAKVAGQTYTLDHIEHEILRKDLFDPRIHVGVNCASISCPKLANFAFTEANIDEKLEALMREFINDTSRNQLNGKKLKISEIFNWFQDDFTKKGSVIDYLNKYATTKINTKAKITYLPYNWQLNGE